MKTEIYADGIAFVKDDKEIAFYNKFTDRITFYNKFIDTITFNGFSIQFCDITFIVNACKTYKNEL